MKTKTKIKPKTKTKLKLHHKTKTKINYVTKITLQTRQNTRKTTPKTNWTQLQKHVTHTQKPVPTGPRLLHL